MGLVLDDNKYYLFSRRANDKIVVYHQEEVNGPLVDESGRVILPILIHRNDHGRWLQMTLTTAGIRPTIALIVRVKMYLFTLRINGKDHDLLAVDKIHVDLNWRYLNEYLDQISANDEVLFLKQGHENIAKNQLAREN